MFFVAVFTSFEPEILDGDKICKVAESEVSESRAREW